MRSRPGLRIAIVAPSLDILGGQAVQAQALAAGLRGLGYDIDFVPVNPRFPSGLRWLRRFPYARTVLNEGLYFASLSRLRRADVVHVFSASYWSFLISAVPAIVAARTLKKWIVLNYRSGEAPDHLARWGLLVHPWLRLVDEIVVPSGFLREVFAGHGYAVSVIRNVVDASRFRFRQRRVLRPKLLSTRNLEIHYGVDNILNAFARVKARYPDATLTVAGTGSQEHWLRHLAGSLRVDGIRFVGRVEPEAMPELHEAADIFLNASMIDNQPNSVLEAFAAGLPVVSTGTGGLADLVRDGETGVIIPPGNPEAMARAVIGLISQPERALTMASRARHEVEHYTWPQVHREWEAIYAMSTRRQGHRRIA